MGVRRWARQHLSMTLQDSGGDAESLRRIEQRAGEVMPGWDNRGIPGTQHNAAEQPQVGFADGELRRIDPAWRPR